MQSMTLRLSALAGLALAVSSAALAAPTTIPPVLGHYEAQNARWAPAPGFVGRGEALHFSPTSHTADQNYMGITLFPVQPLQMGDLQELQVDLFVPFGQTCLTHPKEAVVTIVMLDGNTPKYVFGELKSPAGSCKVNTWSKLDFIGANAANWYAGGIGGPTGTLAQAHTAAKASLGDNYTIDRIRIQYVPIANTEAWFDSASINSLPMSERINDMSANALLPDQQLPAIAGPTLGYFQTRNARWGVSPKVGLHGEAIHFSPWSHDASENFVATSFFPQTPLAIRDLTRLGIAMYLPENSACGTGESLGSYMWLVLSDMSGTQKIDAFVTRSDMAAICAKKDAWQQLDFINGANVRWSLRSTGAGPSFPWTTGLTKEAAHQMATGKLGLDYKIDVVRMNFTGGPHVWFDQKVVNNMSLLERLQDFTTDALLLDTPVIPDGTIPYLP